MFFNLNEIHTVEAVSGIFRVTLFAWPYPLGIIRVGIFRVRNFPRQTYQLDCSKAVKCKGLNWSAATRKSLPLFDMICMDWKWMVTKIWRHTSTIFNIPYKKTRMVPRLWHHSPLHTQYIYTWKCPFFTALHHHIICKHLFKTFLGWYANWNCFI